MAKSGTVTIQIKGPPPYSEKFGGATARVHVRGHLWLKADDPDFTITFTIGTVGFVFDDGTSGNADGPIYTSAQPNPTKFDDCGGVFGDPILSADFMTLTLSDTNGDQNKYFYQLNFLDLKTGTPFHTNDPIMVNN